MSTDSINGHPSVTRLRHRAPTGGYPKGAEARQAIIVAALEVFGQEGFEGASTRVIAERAGVKLPALQYYFGGKEGTYRACAEHIALVLEAKICPALERADRVVSDADPAEALTALQDLLGNLADLLVGGREPESWVMFIMREQARPTAAFELIYERAIGRITSACVALVACTLKRNSIDPEIRVLGFGLVGQVLAFRAARAAALKTLGWRDFRGIRLQTVKEVLSSQVDAIVRANAHPPEAGTRRRRR